MAGESCLPIDPMKISETDIIVIIPQGRLSALHLR